MQLPMFQLGTPIMNLKRICPTCGGEKDERAKQCRHCHLTAIAPLGWAATCAKYGPKTSVKHMREYRLKNPSSLEKLVIIQLDYHGVLYERETWFETPEGDVFLIDFTLRVKSVDWAVEAQGDWAHSHHAVRDAKKLAALSCAGYAVLILDEKTVKDDNALIQALVHTMKLDRMAIPAPHRTERQSNAFQIA